MKEKIRKWLLNILLSETDKVLIIESFDTMRSQTLLSKTESYKELDSDMKSLTRGLKTKTPGCTWYEIEK